MLAKLFVSIGLIFSLSSVWAIEPINGSYQKHYSNEKKQSHWLILGAIERIKGMVKPESEVRVAGKVRSWLWQIPTGMGSELAFDQIKSQVDDKTHTLFECQGRSCGLSNDYANQVFGHAILYGRDSNQHYWLGLQEATTENASDTLWLVYSIQRSNKRVYVYVERIDVDASQAGLFEKFVQIGDRRTLFDQGFLSLASIFNAPASLEAKQISWLKTLLHENPNSKFALVVHRYGQQDHQRLLEQSNQQAQALLDQLAESGGFIKNLYAHGAGGMLPRQKMGDRIELVVLAK